MDSTPKDLLMEIFSRLPAKSVGRFRCVSKQWNSMLSGPYFKELFLTRSRARPRLLFAMKGDRLGEWKFFSSSQPRMPSSLAVATGFQFKFFNGMTSSLCGYASGLICFCDTRISELSKNRVHVICNPSTGQYAVLPKLGLEDQRTFLGFDPIDKQFKVLSMVPKPSCDDDHRILTLGTGKTSWRKIQCPLTHRPSPFRGICINGVIYYLAYFDETSNDVIVCFNVRSEKFKFIEMECFHEKLINYKGKLGVIQWKCVGDDNHSNIELSLWVLDDVEKQEWSKHVYILPNDIKIVNWNLISIVGVTASGEIVLSTNPISKPFYVFYFNPERNEFHRVEIQGFAENYGRVKVFVGHVEDLHVNDAEILKSSISDPYAKRKRGLNITRKRERERDMHEV
ncbi:unnamed protein product [Microthlaspi erraticum]|uniref:F-box domain-containing protein n=1 Tax=Microthlaspi erraticum TaxID=1685480 RepID=A0A6D2L3X5_9BRAS|nr:unnamed protein product [Microthlaspi erraticum]